MFSAKSTHYICDLNDSTSANKAMKLIYEVTSLRLSSNLFSKSAIPLVPELCSDTTVPVFNYKYLILLSKSRRTGATEESIFNGYCYMIGVLRITVIIISTYFLRDYIGLL